ncbi:hypothetical protein [Halomonas sp. C05BenzN]|uniref:hypothetical protein n=1 Tax=Halomonas sp. C05BenzN TaxID=3411041 RepID=UPI003B940D57
MLHRSLSWLLCLLFAIALALPQAILGAWGHEGGECLAEHVVLPGHPDHGHQAGHAGDLNDASMESMTCGAPCPVCNGNLQGLASGSTPSHEPRWAVAESLPLRVPDRLERPPRV